jgi:mycothiol synthase
MLTVRPYRAEDRDALHAMLRGPDLISQFGWLLENHELDDPLHHPFAGPCDAFVAEADDGLAGFSAAFRLDAPRGGAWGVLRVAVPESHRRRGVGRALLAQSRAALSARAGAGAEAKISYFEPSEGGEAFARAMGFEHDRYFWEMKRPGRTAPTVTWPAGIETRTFDGTLQALEDWNDCSNVAFENNAMSARSTIEQCRMLAAQSHFHPSGLLLAYRAGRCVGFCRCALHPEMGDVDVLGVIPEARSIGLGRALVRWGTAWLLKHDAPDVRLTVDGENTRAAELYQSEGFEVMKTRRVWKTRLTG